MPTSPLTVNLVICLNILQEKDHVVTLVRLVDIFYIRPRADIPIEEQAVAINVYGSVKTHPGDDGEHSLQMVLIRPDGTSKPLGEPQSAVMKAKQPGLPGGYNIIGSIGIVPQQMGTHYIALLFDGNEVSRAPFTLQEHEEKTDQK